MAAEGETLSSGSMRLYAMLDDEAVGAVDLYNYDPLNRRCAVGIAVGTPHRRKGYAHAMLRQLELTATLLGLHQLFADIAAGNSASVSLFGKAGYTQCGHFSQWIVDSDGNYQDTIRMQLILS